MNVRVFETGITSRNKQDVPVCPRCGSVRILPLRGGYGKCEECKLLRSRKAFKVKTKRVVF